MIAITTAAAAAATTTRTHGATTGNYLLDGVIVIGSAIAIFAAVWTVMTIADKKGAFK